MISIVGAGPTGSYLAYLLAKQGFEVEIFEEHKEVGKPVHCTGIVTKVLFDLIEYDKSFIVNQLEKVRVISSKGSFVEIPLKEFVIDRALFDPHLAKMAVDAGARLYKSHKFVGIKDGKLLFRHNGKLVERKKDILVGADGPISEVAKASGLYGERKFYAGIQITIKGNFNDKIFETYFGNVVPDFFAWSVPESNKVSRIGIASRSNAKHIFDEFIKRYEGKILGQQPGPIPIYDPRAKVESSNTFLVGDAALLVKATTGGGIITGMLSSKILADCIINNKNYTKALRSLKRELWLHLQLRRMLNKFSEKDYEKLIALMNKEKVKEILANYPREFPSKFLFKLLIAEPRLLAFARHII